jgi:hypothetical protein
MKRDDQTALGFQHRKPSAIKRESKGDEQQDIGCQREPPITQKVLP